jgi:cytochrome oxidase Cu insertion factor (SCO1/SenC/PrrC family)
MTVRSVPSLAGGGVCPCAATGHDERRTTIAMISVGERAPDFELQDHLGRKVKSDDFKGKRHVMLLFYPLDWTPT